MKSVFISFSSQQIQEAWRVCHLLEAHDVTCFISARDLNPGEEYAAQLLHHIDEASVVLLLLSEASNNSPHVLREVEYAVSHHTPIVVYALEEVKLTKSMEYFLMTHQWINLHDNKDEKLLSSIHRMVPETDSPTGSENTNGSATSKAKVVNKDFPQEEKKSGRKWSPLIPIVCVLSILVIILGAFALRQTNLFSPHFGSHLMAKKANCKVGDTIAFGSYFDEPIEWVVLQKKEDGTLLLLSKYILCIKAFDAAESGTYGMNDGVDYLSYENSKIDDPALQVLVRGNNDWSVSNIRTWLNSDKEIVIYEDQPPSPSALAEASYNTESGFLYGFTMDEKNAIVTSSITTPGNALSKDAHGGMVVTDDRVFLLSTNELHLLLDAEVPIFATPTESCIQHYPNRNFYTSFSETYDTDTLYWWLRDSDSEKANEVCVVLTELDGVESYYDTSSAGIAGYGIRPAICIDPKKIDIQKIEEE